MTMTSDSKNEKKRSLKTKLEKDLFKPKMGYVIFISIFHIKPN